MKIVFLNFWARHSGGAEYSLIDIIQQASVNHQTMLITSEPGYLTEMAEKAGCTCIVMPCEANVEVFRRNHLLLSAIVNVTILISFIRYSRKVISCIKEFNPDCIHSNVPKSHILFFLLTFFRYKKKGFIHIREIFTKGSMPYFLYALLFNKHTTQAIAISNEVKQSLPNRIKNQTTVIYNGVQIPVVAQNEYQMRPEPRFLYLGRVVPWKGCDLLIDSFNLLCKKYGEKAGKLSIVGGTYYWDKNYRVQLEYKIKKYSMSDIITLCDHTNDTDPLYRSHTILCLPSDKEPFGRVAAEAMAYGLPVIGFNSGGLPEVVQHNVTGILADERTVDSFFAVMCMCVESPQELYNMGVRGRKRCTELFNKEIQIKKIVEILKSVNEN